MTKPVEDHPENSRFELSLGSDVAYVAYRQEGGRLILTHVEVPPAHSGQGIGSQLARQVLELVRTRGQPVEIRCPFLRSFIARHPDYWDLLED
jgi:predicted GNAT family acetyltransferase